MENKTKQTNFTQLNSLIRTRLNLRKEGKLNFKEGDNLFKKIQKLTLFIYNNAETITEKEMSEALDLVYPDTKGYTKTTFNQRKTSFDYYQSTLSNFTKSFPTEADCELYLGKIQDKEEFRLVAVGHVPTRLHRDGKYWPNRKNKLGEDFSKFTMVSAQKAYGLYKLYQLMTEAYNETIQAYHRGLVEHPGCSLKDLKMIFTSNFQYPMTGSHKGQANYIDPEGIFKTFIFEDEAKGLEIIEQAGYSVKLMRMAYTLEGHGYRIFLRKTAIEEARSGEVNSYTTDYAYGFLDKMILKYYQNDLNVQLLNQYMKDSQSTYASAFMTKKNIPERIQYAMSHSSFVNDFKFVEYDESIELSKMGILEREWPAYAAILPQPMNREKADLRFRLLGKHKARGIFFPAVNSIAVDPNVMSDGKLGVTSFSHEYAHFLDFNHTFDVPLSLQEEFQDILADYQEKLEHFRPDLTPKKANYFKTPTEVFARSFEVYLDQFSNLQSNFKKESITSGEYRPLQDNIQSIVSYFNNLFPGLSERLERYQVEAPQESLERRASHIMQAAPQGVAASRIIEEVHFVEQLSLFDF